MFISLKLYLVKFYFDLRGWNKRKCIKTRVYYKDYLFKYEYSCIYFLLKLFLKLFHRARWIDNNNNNNKIPLNNDGIT